MRTTTQNIRTMPKVRCAIYVRKSTEEGLDSDFNSLDAQRESCEAYIQSRKHEAWVALPDDYSDGGYSGGNMERPGLQRLIRDIEAGKVDVCVVYKIDRLSRSLLDFAKLIELFDQHNVSFSSITQSFDTRTPMGRLTLHVLLSFAQYEREIIGERIRDKVAASKKKGKFMGGTPPIGYDVDYNQRRLIVNPTEAKTVRRIFKRFTETGSALQIARELNADGITTKAWLTKNGVYRTGKPWDKTRIYRVLHNRTYLGETVHKGDAYPGEHEAIIDRRLWERVHTMIEENRRDKARYARTKTPALLRGIIRCGHCDRSMTPVSASSKGKRYRYYQCTRACKNGHDACPVRSVAAGEIEGAVMSQLKAIFRTPKMIAQTSRSAMEIREQEEMGDIHITESDVRDALRDLDPIWDELFPAEQMRIARLLLDSVVVRPDGISVKIRTEGLYSLTTEMKNTTPMEAA